MPFIHTATSTSMTSSSSFHTQTPLPFNITQNSTHRIL